MKPLLLASLLQVTLGLAVASAAPPDLILHHGRIVTVNPKFEIVDAMAVTGDRLSAVGSSADVLKLAGPETKQIDLGGRMVLPGLIDSHVHAASAAIYEFDHPVRDMDTVDDVLAYIRERVTVVPEGSWIVVSQVFITRLRDQRFPTKKELDEAAPKHPVMFRTGPDAMLNSLGLKASGIDRDFEIKDGKSGQIEKDASGEPTGMLRGSTRFAKAKSPDRKPNAKEKVEALGKLMRDYNSVGLTGVAERNAGPDTIEIYQAARESGDLTCRTFLCWALDPNQDFEKVKKSLDEAAAHPLHAYNDRLWLRGVKCFLDGGMLTGSAYMEKPWGVSTIYSITDPEYRGVRQIEADRLYETAKYALERDLQFTAHAVGDAATKAMVDAYRRVNSDFPVAPTRPNITHCNFMSSEVIASMKELGVVADLQPVWLYSDGRTLFNQFGNERMTWFQPYRTLFDKGVIIGGGSDHMQKIGSFRSINAYNPWLGIETAMTRIPRRFEGPLHPEQVITREEAIRLYTINNAFILFDEQNRGSLEPGKLADFIVIDRDLLTCPEKEIRDTQVLSTWVGGQKIYEKQ
ncbi:N-substituted formamide deformylase precursor [Caulifigura coniformis]|uniref:N-substituted formamide deformylase n=1 Tax=Caulifigura coniformis TaxID=2527983 RepID=A0A517SMP2_9PLAN|nr:amidohydrolase [Caulifigura coniformis]QDT57385.1 N-substituted formamide deformylase precursor [Caulifigura coniformis]